MAKQLNVNLAFTADTSKAKAQLQDLQNQLSQVINQPTANVGADMADKINQASRAAAELKVHLEQAMNPKTGTLDFSKLNQSLQKSGTSLTTYAAKLKQIGPEGQKAFSMLAQSVAGAEVPIRRSNALLSELWTTMKNTARWQLTSSMLHGFMGAIQSAYGYAQDLNESLNNIRIVTGSSVEQMADFAKEANKAAKSLSTSTTNYTNAALIYYQQGLNEQQVKERTDITIKMANVSRQSAEEVSDQMTAVWNNFYDGSQSLEHFADVMTRLGADTASSSDEIAQGLEKFASIGEMIGLSFDNAAAALATVTATTRQSADVVGTAFKTIFARIQGLSLGETLEDGTNLNKYSEALNKVGISIFEQNGELKDMDNILDEMGAKWKTMSKDQQVALAQTVAGVRQYNQLVALMDNYDFYEQNLFSAQNADGSLQEQADIYEESWEAASKRVRASLESIYDKLLNDDAFIKLFDNIAKIINGFDAIIDSAGGLKGVLASIAVIVGRIKFDSIVSGVQSASYNIRNTFDGGKTMRQQNIDSLQEMLKVPSDDNSELLTTSDETTNEVVNAQIQSQQYLIDNANKLSNAEQKVLQILLDQQSVRAEQAIATSHELETATSNFDEASAMATAYLDPEIFDEQKRGWLRTLSKELGTLQASNIDKNAIANKRKEIDDFIDIMSDGNLSKDDVKIVKEYSKTAAEQARLKEKLRVETQSVKDATLDENKATKQLTKTYEENRQANEKKSKSLKFSAEGFVNGATAAFSMVSAISMLSSAYDTLHDPDLSGWEKFSSISMSLMMALPMLISSFKSLNDVLKLNTLISIAKINTDQALIADIDKELGKNTLLIRSKKLLNNKNKESIANALAEKLVKIGLIKETEKEAFVTAILEKIKQAKNAEEIKEIILDEIKLRNKKLLNLQMLKEIGNQLLVNIAKLKYIAIAAAVAAAIWAIVYASQAEERALKSAQKGVKNATDAYRELQQAYEDLNQSIADYQDAYKALKKLEEGAEGYQEALEKSNEAARKLIEANGLFDDWHYDDKGAIVFNEDALDAAKNEAKNKVNAASLNVQATNVKYIEAQKDSITPWAIEGVWAETLGSVSSEVFDTVKQAVERGASFDLKAEDLNLTTEQLSNLVTAINLLGTNAENVYNQLTKLNQQSEYYAESFALSAAQMNGIYGAEGEENVQKAYANLIAQDDKYQQQLKDNAEKAKHATDNEIISALYSVNKDTYNSIMKNGIFSDEELARLYMRDVKGWSEQDAAAAVYKGGNGKGTLTLGDQSFEYNDQQMRNELLTKYLADQMAQNLGANGEDQAIKDILDLVSGVSNESENGEKTSDGEAELLNSLMNYKEGERISIDWGEMTPEEYTTFMADIGEMSGNAYAEAFNSVLVDEEQQRLMYENAQRQKEAAELESIFAAGAAATGISEAALESYAESLMEVNEMTNEQRILAAKTAVQHAKLAKGLNKVQDIYNDNIDVLKEADEASLDYHEAVGKLSEALTETFGLEVSPSFVKNADNLELIKKAAEGDVEALQDLRQAINTDFVAKLDLSTVEAENALTEFLNYASDEAAGKPIGSTITLDNTNAIAAINEALYTGKATIEDIEAMFNNANLAMPEYKTTTVPGEMVHTTSTAHYKGPLGIEWDVTSDTTTTTDRVIPYFGDKAPSLQDGKMDYGGGGTIDFSTQSNSTSLDNALDYEGDDGDKGKGNKGKGGKNYKPEIERYHEITRAIENQKRALDDLSNAKDEAFGASKISLMEQEIIELEKLKQKQEELLAEQEKDFTADKLAVQSLFPDAKFGKNNEILNFNELMSKTTNEEQAKILEQYEKTLDAIETTKIAIMDLDDEIQNASLEKITTEVDFEIEINQRDIDKLDYVIDKLGRNLNTAIEQIDALGQQIGKYDSQSQSYRQGIADIEANAAAQGRALTEDEQQKIQEYKDALLDINGALLDIVETVEAKILEEFDEFNSKIDDNISRFDTYNSMLDHYNNIIKLSGRQTKDSMLMMELSAQKTETSLQKLNATRDKYLAQKSVQDDVASKLAEAQKSGNEADIKYWQEQYDEITKTVEESHDEMLASWEETLEAAGSQFDLAIETTIQTLKDSISEFGLDNLADRYSKGQEEQERYLSNLDKEYELNKLNREISGKIDDTDNIRAKQKLLELQDEINKKLASGEEMSRYDLEHLQKKYELELAKIALEEAQNAKSTVRLTKDSEGNFGYVYTADQDSIDNAQQNYEDKLYELKKSSEDYLDEMSEKIIQNQQEMMEALAEVDRTKFETQEEYEAEFDRIKEYYMGRDKYYRGEMQKAMDELGITYQETLLGQLEGSASLEEAQSKLETNTNETVSKMGEAWKEWHDTVGNAMEEAGTSSETFTEDIKSDAEEIGTATEDLADVIDEQTENMVDYMGRLVEAVADWRDQYISAIDEIIKKNEELANVQAASFDKDSDYSALINEYLNNGGEVGDVTYKELRKQRDAKIDWLEEQGYDSSYWGTRGSETDEMYSRIAGGGGTAEEEEWFTKDYIDDEKLAEIFNKLEVPLGALEQTVGNINTGTQEIKTATDTVGGKIDATQNYFNATSNAINTKNAEISGTIGDKLDANSQNALNQISTTEGSINQSISDAEKSLAETLSETVSGGKTLSDIDSSISDAIAAISADINAAKKEIQEDIGSLSRQVNTLGTAAVGGAMGGPAGALIGGLVGGVISAATTMDTGGYTGSWGPEGKVAVLHEKELVLNKNDTSNLLNTLGVMKDIMHMIDVQANMASLSHLNAVSDIKSLNDTLEQNVTIHAEFPNATNRNEIEEAFSNLVNRATQYANRKK